MDVLAPEREQLPGQRGSALGRAADLGGGRLHQRVLTLVEQHIGVAHRHLEQVVEIVRDTRRQLADRLHLLRPAHFLFRRADAFERGAELRFARAQRRSRPIAAVDQPVADERDRRVHRQGGGIPGESTDRGKRHRGCDSAQHRREHARPSASPVRRDRHRGKHRCERRDREQRPREPGQRYATQRHEDGEDIGFPEGTQERIGARVYPVRARGETTEPLSLTIVILSHYRLALRGWNRFHSRDFLERLVPTPAREVDMTRRCVHRFGSWVAFLCCAAVCVSTPPSAQRADRATISGVVTDNQGAAVPGATVTIKNEDTGVDNVLMTNAPAPTRARRWCSGAIR